MDDDEPQEDANGNIDKEREAMLEQTFDAGSAYLKNIDQHAASDRDYARCSPETGAPSPWCWPYYPSDWGSGGSACRDDRRDWSIGPLPTGLASPKSLSQRVTGLWRDVVVGPSRERPQVTRRTCYKGSSDDLWSRDGEGSRFAYDEPSQHPPVFVVPLDSQGKPIPRSSDQQRSP